MFFLLPELDLFRNLFIILFLSFTPLDRSIIRDTKQLRVNLSDFDVKSQIGNGYFGEVHVSLIIIIDELSDNIISLISWSLKKPLKMCMR